jgi:hypothetical protein
MIGKVFTRLTVIEFSHKDKRSRFWWRCKCECGKEKVLHTGNLNSGNTKSCGCYREEFRKETAKRKTLPNDGGSVNQIILGYKRHAKNRGIEWKLPRDFVDQIIRKPCFYCGVFGGNLKKTKNNKDGFRHNGIDRVERERLYTEDNVVACCGTCNMAKGKMSADKFLLHIVKIYKNQGI